MQPFEAVSGSLAERAILHACPGRRVRARLVAWSLGGGVALGRPTQGGKLGSEGFRHFRAQVRRALPPRRPGEALKRKSDALIHVGLSGDDTGSDLLPYRGSGWGELQSADRDSPGLKARPTSPVAPMVSMGKLPSVVAAPPERKARDTTSRAFKYRHDLLSHGFTRHSTSAVSGNPTSVFR